jgi:hypothetical protein
VDFVDVMAYNKGGILASPATLLGLPQEYAVTHSPPSAPPSLMTPVIEFDRLDPMIMGDMKIAFKIFKADYLDQLSQDSATLRACSSLSWVRIAEEDFCLALPCHKDSILLIKEEGSLWTSWIHKKVKSEKGVFQTRKFVAKHEILEPAFRGWDAWVWQKYGSRVYDRFNGLDAVYYEECRMEKVASKPRTTSISPEIVQGP